MAEQTWLDREAVILEAVASAEAEAVQANQDWIVERTGLSGRDVGVGLKALMLASPPYVQGSDATAMGGTPYFLNVELLERGRREVGAWPSQEGALEGFLELLAQRASEAEDEDERTRLERLREVAGDVGRPVLSGLLLAYIKTQTGI